MIIGRVDWAPTDFTRPTETKPFVSDFINGARLYFRSKSIAADLARIGLTDWQNKLNDAISSGSGGTEIAMALRFHMSELLKTQPLVDEAMFTGVQSTVAHLNDLLK